MKRSNRLVILVGVLLAVLAFVAIVILLNQAAGAATDGDRRADDRDRPRRHARTSPSATPVTPDMVEARTGRPRRRASERALTSPSQLQGQPALFAVPDGLPGERRGHRLGRRREHRHRRAARAGREGDRLPGRPRHRPRLPRHSRATTSTSSSRQQISVLQETADSAANPDRDAPPRFEAVTGLENQRTVKAILQDKRVLYVSDTRAITAGAGRGHERRRRGRRERRAARDRDRQRDHRLRRQRPGRRGDQVRPERARRGRLADRRRPPRR